MTMANDDPEFVTELIDIMEEYSDDTIKKNIIYILKREKLWDKGFEVIFPVGAFKEIDVENDGYQFDFEIWKGNEIIASGTCYGGAIRTEEGGSEILDMTLEIGSGYEKLVRLHSKEKVTFT
jgi:vacuolar-type H+-ATPase subunit E/Vma4